MALPKAHVDLSAVPLFPLPNVVLFPRAVLPLHIFEERYKTMTADVLEGDRHIAMALLKPGWEKCYYEKPAIDPVVCVGQILSWEKLPDGKYNFLLQGQCRARVLREHGSRPYRIAELAPLEESHVMEIDLEDVRGRFSEVFTSGRAARLPVARQFQTLLSSPLSTADIADLAAFNFLDDVELKQSLLGEADVRSRLQRIVAEIEEWDQHISLGLHGFPEDPGEN